MPWDSNLIYRIFLPDPDYFTHSISRQLIIIMMLLCYHLWFQIDFACSCTLDRNYIHCYGYMVLPCLIISSIVVWNDKRIGRIFRFCCFHSSANRKRCKGKFYFEFFRYVLQAGTSGFLWCGSVLIDGDWYLCCGVDNTEEIITFSCMNESVISPASLEEKIHLKNHSMVSKASHNICPGKINSEQYN